MTSYDFSGNSQWGQLYPLGGATQSILPHVPQAPQPLPSSWDHSSPYLLTVKQQPERAKAANAKDKDRKPIDPPPILQLDVDPSQDPLQVYITSPYLFVQTFLIGPTDSDPEPDMNTLAGNTCTSGHVVKDDRGVHNMMFCLNDISVKKEGTYRLKFCLFKLNTTTGDVEKLTSVCSHPFTTYSGRHFPGMSESTSMTRLLVDAGVRLRLRKESKAMSTKKKNNAFAHMMSGRGRDDEEERPMKRLRSEPEDENPMSSYTKHGSYSTAHSYSAHSTSSSSMGHFPGAYHAVTSSPSQNISSLSSIPTGYNTGLHSASPMLGLDTQVNHYHHSPTSVASSYQSPGRQSPTTGYPLHVSTSSSQGLVATSPLGQYGSSHSAQAPILPPVDMASSQTSSSPDINYTTSATYSGGYMPSRGLPSMQHRGSLSSSMPMRMNGPVFHNGHSIHTASGPYGEGSLFEPYHYGPRDGH
ncbi:hypothetical protein VM1G_05054 [Cytospora mali]|uniref:Velvet domain-containing protein n=1 Tax=Cytospora mali TaxID=578113 RepID=A0A194VZZ5_CYTMA|nr:hypothetical protein VM1G_05054 [Valsa mali]